MGFSRDIIDQLAEDQALERQTARADALNALHRAAVTVAYAHSIDAMTDDEAEEIGIGLDVVGQAEPLADVMRRMGERLTAARAVPLPSTAEIMARHDAFVAALSGGTGS